MARLQQRGVTGGKQKVKPEVDRSYLSVIFGSKLAQKELDASDEAKITVFEKGLFSTLDKADTIEQAIGKIVKTALACEFGPSFLLQKGAKRMVNTISHGIMSDAELRKQALIIMDKHANQKMSKKIIKVGASGKAN